MPKRDPETGLSYEHLRKLEELTDPWKQLEDEERQRKLAEWRQEMKAELLAAQEQIQELESQLEEELRAASQREPESVPDVAPVPGLYENVKEGWDALFEWHRERQRQIGRRITDRELSEMLNYEPDTIKTERSNWRKRKAGAQ